MTRVLDHLALSIVLAVLTASFAVALIPDLAGWVAGRIV